MKKLLLTCMTALSLGAAAQVGPPQATNPNTNNGYGFAQTSGTYAPLSSGRTIWQSGATLATDAVSSAVTLPFTFKYNGKNYTNLYISNNGFVTFGSPTAVGTYTGLSTDLTTTGNVIDGSIAGFSANLKNANTTTSEISYETVGSKFIVQFTDLQGNSASASQLITFQIQLDSSNNSVAIVYGNCASGTATLSGEVGLKGAESSDVNNRTGSNWTTTAIGTSSSSTCTLGSTGTTTIPSSGLTFTFTPGTWLAAPTTYATIPFTENFSTWVNGNSTADLPNATYWRSWPSRGDNSWRASNSTITGFTTSSGWTSVSGAATIAVPAVVPTARFHSYNTVGVAGYMDLYVNLSGGGVGNRVIAFDYINTSGTDKLDVLLSTDGGVTFTNLGSSLGVAAAWGNKSFTTSSTAANAIVRLLATGDNGSTDIQVDNLTITVSALPPVCTTISAPANAATGVAINPTITWNPAPGATSYVINIGTTAGGTNIMNAVDVGNVTTYTIPAGTPLNYSTQYYITILPKNTYGTASACTETSFTTLVIPCPSVTSPASSATGVSLMPNITWTAVTGATGYKLSVGTTAGATDVLNNQDLGNVLNYTFSSSLTPATKYFYKVNSYSATSTSASCTERNFTTACNALPAPFTETFSGGVLPSCWSTYSTNGTSYALWQFNAATQDYGTTYTATGQNNTAGQFAFVDASSPYTGVHDVTLQAPDINLAGVTNPFLEFRWFKNHSSTSPATTLPTYDNNLLTVQVKKVADATWNTVFSSSTNNTAWRTEGITLPSTYVGSTIQVRFVVDKDVAGNGYFYDNLLLDDVKIKEAPVCFAPTAPTLVSVTTNSVTVSWTAPSSVPANGYEIYYSTTNTAPTATTVLNATNSVTSATLSTTIPSLTSSTTYYVWVRSSCSATAKSDWSATSVTATTTCTSVGVPYTQDFESVTVPALPTCTSVVNDGTGNAWNTYSLAASGFTGKVLNYLYVTTSAANTWFFTQGINLTAGTSYRIKYKYGNASGTTYPEKLKVAYGNSATSAAMINLLADYPNVNNTTASSVFVDFTPATTGVYYFGFQAYSDANMNRLYVDDINVDITPSCTEPTAIVTSNITTNSATLAWTAPATAPASGYQVYYSTSNTVPTATTTPTLSVTAVTTPLSPLTPATTYYVWVRSNCGSSQSPWTTMTTFTTLATPPANDNCSSPTPVTPGATFTQNAVTATTIGATLTSDTTAVTACQTTRYADTWYSVVVPASGSVTLETKSVTGSNVTDTVLAAYTGSCGTLTSVGCNDDDGDGNFSLLTVTGQIPGSTLLVGVWNYSATNNGQFQISAYDASLATSENVKVKNDLTVYPNPFADVLNISDVKNVKSVSVIDIAGRLVKTIEKPTSALQLGDLKSGMYVVVLNMNDGSKQSIKAIKK